MILQLNSTRPHVRRWLKMLCSPADGRAKPSEIRDAVQTAHNALAIERHRLHSECRQPLRDPRHGVGPVIAASGKDANTVALAVADEPKTVVLDLVDPLRRSRDGAAKGREAGFDEADWPASGSGGTPEHVAYITVERANAKSTITAAPPSAFRAAQTERLGCTAGTARTG